MNSCHFSLAKRLVSTQKPRFWLDKSLFWFAEREISTAKALVPAQEPR
jgi:hypothetical protein